MDLRYLEAMVAVADELHFGRAAEKLHISQPPLTNRIQQAERELGVKVFERGRHGVTITPMGKQITAEARQVLAASQKFSKLARSLREGTAGSLTIAAVGSAFYEALPALLRRCRQELPEVSLHITELETPQLIDAIQQGSVDVGFVRPPLTRTLNWRTVWTEPLAVAVSTEHPYATRNEITASQLVGERIVFFERELGSGYWDHVNAIFQKLDAPFAPQETADHVTTILGIVAIGTGISIVPSSARHLALPGVHYVPLVPATMLPLAVVTGTEDPSPTLRAFLNLLPASP